MQRHENESFDAYKARRANSNAAVKRINRESKSGPVGSREKQRRDRDNSKHAGSYGRNLMAASAQKRATPSRLATHNAYVERMQSRKAARASA